MYYSWNHQQDLYPYLTSGTREYYGRPGLLPGGHGMASLLMPALHHPPHGRWQPDAYGRAGERPGASLEALREGLLDQLPVDRAILTFADANAVSNVSNGPLSVELCNAVNRWTAEQWLSGQDERLYGLVIAPVHLPEQAASEIRRAAEDPRMVGVQLSGNPLGRHFGHELYAPIHRACAELGLPLVLTVRGDDPPNTPAHPTAGGYPSTFSESHLLRSQSVAAHLLSLIVSGVLERNRGLKIIIVGAGVSWLPPFLWRANEAALSYAMWDAPWLERTIAEQVHAQVRLCTHTSMACVVPDSSTGHLPLALEGLQDTFMFGSGYPSWDTEHPGRLQGEVAPALERSLFHDVALESYRWPDRR